MFKSTVARDPFAQFEGWFAAACDAGVLLAEGMTISTIGADGGPDCRVVLLKDFGPDGLVFYTNLNSPKASQLAADGRASAVFWWPSLERQVRFRGRVTQITDAIADDYFATRPRESQLGAWASPQSEVVADRPSLDAMVAEVELRFSGKSVPRPPFWGGYRLLPEQVEFWQGRGGRLHDRLRYSLRDGDWQLERLAP